MVGTKVTGKTVGIIGFGRIGKAFAQRCHFGFGMDVVFYNRSQIDPAEAARYGARQLASVEEVLAASDFVSLHVPRRRRKPASDECCAACGNEARRLPHQYGARRRGR